MANRSVTLGTQETSAETTAGLVTGQDGIDLIDSDDIRSRPARSADTDLTDPESDRRISRTLAANRRFKRTS